MLSRSKGRHKITFQQLPMSFNSKVMQSLIIGIGLVSSLAAFFMILNFAGLKPQAFQEVDISNWIHISVADILTDLANGIAQKIALL